MRILCSTLIPFAVVSVAFAAEAMGAVDSKIAVDRAQIEAEVQAVFDQVIADREKAFAAADVKLTEVPENARNSYNCFDSAIYEDELTELAVKTLGLYDHEAIAPVYRAVVLEKTTSTDPKERSLACHILRMVDEAKAMQALGELLDDEAEGCLILSFRRSQRLGSKRDFWSRPTVAQAARSALNDLTILNFRSKADFDEWWQANRDCESKIWYWSAKWRKSNILSRSRITYTLIRRNPDYRKQDNPLETMYDDLRRLGLLTAQGYESGEAGLKILLLYNNGYAIHRELEISVQEDYKELRSRIFNRSSNEFLFEPSYKAIAGYVKEHNLKERLFELLEQENLYPEVSWSITSIHILAWKIIQIGEQLFDTKDDARLAEIQQSIGSQSKTWNAVVILRSRVSPARGVEILSDGLRERPNREIAIEMLEKFGTAQPELLLEVFEKDDWSKSLPYHILKAAEAKRPISTALIADMAAALPEKISQEFRGRGVRNRDGGSRSYRKEINALQNLVKAANLSSEREIISEDELQSITRQYSKLETTEEIRAHNAGIPAAYEKVRGKLIAELRKEP